MFKEKRILSYILSWFLVGYIIFVIGTNNVLAATYYTNYGYAQQYYDNNGSTVTPVTTTWNESLQSYVSSNITTVANSYGAGLSITSPIPLIANHTYTLSIYFENISNIALSSKNNISIGNSLESARYNYANSNYWVDMVQSSVNNNSVLQFVFTAKGGANFIFIPWTTTTTASQTYVLTQINMEDLGSEGISQEDINTSLNNQTTILNDYIQNSTDTITGAIGDTETNINNNIDNMGEEIKDSIKDNFNTCRDSLNLAYNVTYDSGSVDWWTLVTVNSTNIIKGKTYTVSVYLNADNNTQAYWNSADQVFYEKRFDVTPGNNRYSYTFTALKDTTNFSVILSKLGNGDNILITPSKLQIQEGSYATEFEDPNTEICSNKIDETNDKLDETNQNLGDIKDSLTDSSPTDMSSLGDSAGWLPPGPVDSILNLPLTFFLNLSESLSSECRPVELTLPFVNEKIYLPCIRSLYDKMGVTGTIFTTAGVIASAVILFNYLLALYKWVDDTLTLRENTMPGYYEDNWGGGA